MNNLEISREDKNAVISEAKNGKIVLVPEKNITLNNWTGTGYIATNGNKGVSFVITNRTNGGISTGEITADLSCVVLGSATLLADSVMLIDLGVGLLLTGNVILAAVVIAFAATMMYQAIESYSDAVSLYLDAASGSETAEQSAEQLKTHAKIGALTFAGSLIAGPVLQKAGSVAVTAGEKIAQTRFGNVVGYVFEKTGKPIADKIYNWGSGVNSAVRRTNLYQRMIEGSIREEIAAELVIREYTDDVLEKIWRSNKSEELAAVLKDASGEYVEFQVSFDIGKPSIGVAKSYYKIEDTNYKEPGKLRGESTDIVIHDEVYGCVLRTMDNVKPVFVSAGNYISLKTSIDIVLSLIDKDSHIPVPTREADLETHKKRTECQNTGRMGKC